MEFCEQCQFMLYTKLEDKGKNSEGKDCLKLMNYCKNCGYEKERDATNESIYERNYQKNFIADKLLSNKYTIIH